MPGREFLLTEEQVLGLPLDVLGIEILRDLVHNAEYNGNARNWLLMARNGGKYSNEAIQVLNEGWEWLQNNGLVVVDHEKMGEHFVRVTRLGYEIAESGDAERLRAAARLSLDLHPLLEGRVRPQFLMGEFELAAFAAMKAVEIRVRGMAGLANSDVGVPLMRKAFGPGGSLYDESIDPGERDARRELFSGAIGTIKNPTSHHDVSYDDPTEASEAILLADLLMRILDRIPNPAVEQ